LIAIALGVKGLEPNIATVNEGTIAILANDVIFMLGGSNNSSSPILNISMLDLNANLQVHQEANVATNTQLAALNSSLLSRLASGLADAAQQLSALADARAASEMSIAIFTTNGLNDLQLQADAVT
jgi:hypothetical protein